MSITRVFLFMVLVTSVGSAQGVPHLTRSSGQHPNLEAANRVVQGEAMYTAFDYPMEEIALLSEAAFHSKKINLAAGEKLRRKTFKNGDAFCSTKVAKKIGDTNAFVCLVDRNGDSAFEAFAMTSSVSLYYRFPRKMPISPAIPFTVELAAANENEATDWVGDFYRKEIVYQGAAGGVLRLLYREYVNSLARAAFSQELTFDVGDEPITISVRSVRMEILRAGTEGIEYRILQGFSN